MSTNEIKKPDFGTHIYNPGSFGSDFMGKPEALAIEVAQRLGLYEILPQYLPTLDDWEFSYRFDVGIYPLGETVRLKGLLIRLNEMIRIHSTPQLIEQKRLVTARLKQIDKDFKDWQRAQRDLREKYPVRTIEHGTHHDVDEGSRAEYDCCGL